MSAGFIGLNVSFLKGITTKTKFKKPAFSTYKLEIHKNKRILQLFNIKNLFIFKNFNTFAAV